MTYRNRIGQQGPKRLLALDGGGIRGVLSLEILAAIETPAAARARPVTKPRSPSSRTASSASSTAA